MEKSKIIFDAEKLKNPYSGLGQFCISLGKALLYLIPNEIEFYIPKNAKHLVNENCRILPQKSVHKLFGVPIAENSIYHATHQTTKYFPSSKKVPVILTIHDLNFLYKYNKLKSDKKLKELQYKIDRCQLITAISKFTANEIRKYIDVKGKNIEVIYNGNSLQNYSNAVKPKWITEKPFLFTIGIIQERKNFHTLIPLMQNNRDLNLVIAGDATSEYASKIQQNVKATQMNNQIFIPGKITDAEKLWLYQNCLAFVFPSLAEGFGFPVIEAMSLGKPVFVYDGTSLPEIAGKYGNYWKNFEPNHMTDVLLAGLHNYTQNNLKNNLIEHASQFNWQNAAKKYVEIYHQLIKK